MPIFPTPSARTNFPPTNQFYVFNGTSFWVPGPNYKLNIPKWFGFFTAKLWRMSSKDFTPLILPVSTGSYFNLLIQRMYHFATTHPEGIAFTCSATLVSFAGEIHVHLCTLPSALWRSWTAQLCRSLEITIHLGRQSKSFLHSIPDCFQLAGLSSLERFGPFKEEDHKPLFYKEFLGSLLPEWIEKGRAALLGCSGTSLIARIFSRLDRVRVSK